jgi:S-DNA-T family DNA segregation ATPase FtsK/SpoIIIE
MTTQPIQLQPEHVKISAGVTLLAWAVRKLGRLLLITARSPAKLAALLPIAAIWWLGTIATWTAIGFTLLCLGVAAAWAMQFPTSYQHHISGRARGTMRSLFIYRWRWASALKDCGVILRRSDAPLLLRTNSTKVFDRLTVRMTPGQRPEDWANNSDRMAQTFGALNCRVTTTGKPHWLELIFLTADPLTEPVNPYPPEPDALTHGLPIARTEDGKPWRLKLVGSHLLIVGATGGGKSGVLWAIIHALLPAIDDGIVKLWVMDPKGGMELAGGRHRFDRFVYGHRPTVFAGVLDEAVQIMQARQDALRGVAQLHTPTVRQPLYVIMIDEMAALTAWNTDRAAQKRIQTALALLQSQGRAVGVIVIGAVQDPSKETLPSRREFTIRICLRVVEAAQVGMVFGPGARERGAHCDTIPAALPGVGYVQIDGEEDHTRVRFAHITPAMIGATKGDLPQPEAEEPAQTSDGIFIA